MRKIFFISILISIFHSCSYKSKQEILFESLFKDISNLSIKKHELNWNKIEKAVKDSIKHFRSYDDFYAGVEYTLKLMNDRHSFFLRPEKNFLLEDTVVIHNNDNLLIPASDTLLIPDIESKIVGNNIGYLKISGFGANPKLSELYARKIRKALIELDNSADLSGWIIDLKDNNGGRAFSQPLGLSPLFNDSVIGYDMDNDGKFHKITCVNNTYKKEPYRKQISIDYKYTLNNKNKKIAVLINNKTASCGEHVALILKSQKNSQLFGTETKGTTTTLQRIKFSNGAFLLLATEYWADNNKNKIIGGIKPHIECSNEESLGLAINWIKSAI